MIEKFPWFTCIRPNAKIWPTSASLPISNRRPMMPIINGAISRARQARKSTSLKPKQNDIVVKKFRYSGFYGTQLENLLRALGRDTIAITGVTTNVCCDSTARDGAMRYFKVVFLSDCSASFSPEAGRNPKIFEKHFGPVMDSHTFVERISQ